MVSEGLSTARLCVPNLLVKFATESLSENQQFRGVPVKYTCQKKVALTSAVLTVGLLVKFGMYATNIH